MGTTLALHQMGPQHHNATGGALTGGRPPPSHYHYSRSGSSLLFATGTRERISDRAQVCRHNLLLRREHVSDVVAAEVEAKVASTRTSNIDTGRGKHFADKTCVRVLGPFLPVFALNGDAIVSKSGHPLGDSGHKWYRPAHMNVKTCKRFVAWVRRPFKRKCAWCSPLPATIRCPASLYVQCTEKCMICGSGGLNALAPFLSAGQSFSHGRLVSHRVRSVFRVIMVVPCGCDARISA